MKSKRRIGIALAIVMVMLTVLTLIIGAFFQAYRSHFSLTRSSAAGETAAAGCDTVFDYVNFRLEHDRLWGSADFANEDQDKDPAGEFLSLTSKVGTHEFSGTVQATGATFEGTIYNNLAGGNAESEGYPRPGTARCRLSCKSGDSTKRVEFLLTVAPLFDSSVLTRSNLKVDAEKLIMRSLDKDRNMLRSEKDIYVPDMLGGEERTKFYQPGSTDPDINGMLWAKGEIYSYDSLGSSAEMLDTDDELSEATLSSNGKLVSKAESHFSIFDLKSEQIELPKDQTVISDVPPGRYNFIRRPASVTYEADYGTTATGSALTTQTGTVNAWVDVLEYYGPGNDSEVPDQVFRAANRTEDIIDQIPPDVEVDVMVGGGRRRPPRRVTVDADLNDDSVSALDVTVDIPGYGGNVVLTGDTKVFGDPLGANLTFNLLEQRVDATPDALVDVNGPFQLTSGTDSRAATETPAPVLNLGYDPTPSADGEVSTAVIRANGTINIENGVTEGLGALISLNGDVRVQPKDTKSVTVDSDLAGLLIFADGDVVLQNPDRTEDWNFKGLVYARGGILMDGHGAANASFEGTIVSLQENTPEAGAPDGIEFVDCDEIEFIYNGDLLDSYVKQLEGGRIQVETVYWKD